MWVGSMYVVQGLGRIDQDWVGENGRTREERVGRDVVLNRKSAEQGAYIP